jgi:hypothetical protein
VSAALCLLAIHSGVFILFFLFPLGFMAYGYHTRAAWVSTALVIGGNALWLLATSYPATYPWLSMGYFTVILLLFTWIVAPPFSAASGGIFAWSTAYRLIIASAFAAVSCGYLMEAAWNTEAFKSLLESQMAVLRSMALSATGTDVVRRSLLEQQLDTETVMAQIRAVALRGGAVGGCAVLFFINRQLGLVVAALIRRSRMGTGMIHFHTPGGLIWVLSLSLLGVLVGTVFSIDPLEIGAWNGVTICGLLYLAQGGGIMLHLLARLRLSPLLRVALHIALVILICSPNLNLLALGALGLLGIAEHWVSFRAPKSDGSSSTPGM